MAGVLTIVVGSLLSEATSHPLHFFSQALPSQQSLGERAQGDDPYTLFCCTTSAREVPEEVTLRVTRGAIPQFLRGDWILMAGSKFEIGSRRVGHIFDAFAKVHKFRFAGDRDTLAFSARFVHSQYYDESMERNDLSPSIGVGRPSPPFRGLDKVRAVFGSNDNTLINVWALGDDTFITNTESSEYNEIDRGTLATRGKFKMQDAWSGLRADLIPSLSAPHAQYLGGGGSPSRGRTTINWIGTITLGPGGVGMDFQVVRQRWGSRARQAISQKLHLDSIPVIHSFGVTDKYAIFLLHPLSLGLRGMLLSQAATAGFQWQGEKPSKVLILDISGADEEPLASKLPALRVLETASFFSIHHINTYEEEGKLVTQVACYDNGDFFEPGTGFGFLEVELNATKRRERPVMRYCEVSVDLKAGTVDVRKFDSGRAEDGELWAIEMPRFNEEWQGRRNCYLYGTGGMQDKLAHQSRNFTMSTVKRNLCGTDSGEQANILTLTRYNHFAWEPTFVPNGGPAEDDGVLLVMSMDGEKRTSYLLILNAKDMSEIAAIYLPEGFVIPNPLHSRFFSNNNFPPPGAATPSEAETVGVTTAVMTLSRTAALSLMLTVIIVIAMLRRDSKRRRRNSRLSSLQGAQRIVPVQ